MDIKAYEDFLQIVDSIAGSEMSFRYEVERERGYQIVKYNAFSVKFGEVKAVRMIDEGIVQTDIYSENEVQKYKKEKFKNMIYEVVGGQFKDEIKSIADGYLDVMDVKHYVIVTMNYNIDIISEGEPEIEIKS